MIHSMAEEITFWLARHKLVVLERKELVTYGMEVILLNTITLILPLLISICFGAINHYIIFLICFVPIRLLLGGWHCQKSEQCIIISTIFYLSSVGLVLWVPQLYTNLILQGIAIVAAVVVISLPIEISEKQPLQPYQYQRNKRFGAGIVVLEIVLFEVLNWNHDNLATSVLLFFTTALVLNMMGRILK